MKTLLFAPMYLDGPGRLERNKKWITYYVPEFREKIGFDEVFLVDNASSKENLQDFMAHCNPLCRGEFTISINHCVIFLDRISTHAYGYWYRAFAKAVQYAKANGYDKIVHIDTDVYLLNDRICNYVKSIDKGWTAMWCGRWNYPESTFQIICKDQFNNAEAFMTEGYLQFYPYDIAETRIPWTHVEKGFVGDRYGEVNAPQKPDMEWYGQCPNNLILRFNK